ncbi:MAG: RluA family pseudouridine synthase [Balneolales bacterium]
MDIPVIYEDNHLLVVDKPINMPSQKDESKDLDLQSSLKALLKEKYGKPGNVFLALVQRLDRPVSGVMVLAKTSKAASRLSDQIRTRTFSKKYQAVVIGQCPPKGKLVNHLIKDAKTNITSVVPASSKYGKEAILEFTRLGFQNGCSLIEVKLITGRPHQIRVQFAAAGFPLWGDKKYGEQASLLVRFQTRQKGSIALRSVEINFNHPTKNEPLQFEVERPGFEPWSYFSF